MGLPFAFVRGAAPGASQALAARASSLDDTLFPRDRGILRATLDLFMTHLKAAITHTCVVSNRYGLHDDITVSDAAQDWRGLADLQALPEATMPTAVWHVWWLQGETLLWHGLQCLGSDDAAKDSKTQGLLPNCMLRMR